MKTNMQAWLLLLCAGLPAQKLALEETHRLRFSFGITQSMAFSPDDRFLACGGMQGDLIVHEIATKKKVLDLDVARGPIHRCFFFPDGKSLVTLTEEVTVVSFPEGRILKRAWANGASLEDPRLAISRDGKWIAYRHGARLLIREVASWKTVAQATIYSKTLDSLAFGPRSEKLLIGSTSLWRWRKPGSKIEYLNADRKKGNRIIKALWPGPGSELLLVTDGQDLLYGEHRKALPAKVLTLAASRDGSRIAVMMCNQGILFLDSQLKACGSIPTKPLTQSSSFTLGSSGRILAFNGHAALSSIGQYLLASLGQVMPTTLWIRGGSKSGVVPELEMGPAKEPAEDRFVRLGGNATNAARASSIALDPHGRFLAVCAGSRITTVDLNTGTRRNLGKGVSVGQGWRPGEILMSQEGEHTKVFRVQADLGERTFLAEQGGPLVGPRSTILQTSPSPRRILFAAGFWRLFGELWTETEEPQDLAGISNPVDASWSRDGKQLLVVGYSTSCIAPTVGEVMITGDPGPRLWTGAACKASRRLGMPLTGDFAPNNGQVAWGGRGGIVTYTPRPDRGEPTRLVKTPTIHWLRYRDKDHILTHDGQQLSLWRARDLKRLAIFNPFRVPQELQRGNTEGTASKGTDSHPTWNPDDDPPIFIHKAVLSRDRKRLVLAGKRDVRVFDLSIK